MKEIMEKYFVDSISVEDEKIDILLGNGFTLANQTKEFSYEKFSDKIYLEIKSDIEELKKMRFYNSLFMTPEAKVAKVMRIISESSIENGLGYTVEELLTEFEKLKFFALESESDAVEIIDRVIDKVNRGFEELFGTRNKKDKQREKKYINKKFDEKIDMIFSTNYIPDYNFLLDVAELPVNYINANNNKLINPKKCNFDSCIDCIEENGKVSCNLNTNKVSIFYLHGGYNIGYNKYTRENLYRSKVNQDIEVYRMHIVSGGNSRVKLDMISKHTYTAKVFNIFDKSPKSMYVVGNSLSNMDSHIIENIAKRLKNGKTLYYEVYYTSEQELMDKIVNIIQKFDYDIRDNIKFIEACNTPDIMFVDRD